MTKWHVMSLHEMGWLSWIVQVGTKDCRRYPWRREVKGDHTHTATQRKWCADGADRDRSDAATSQGMPAATRSWKRQGQILPGGNIAPPDFRLLASRIVAINICGVKTPCLCGNLIAATGDEQMLAEALLLANKKASTSKGERLRSS